MQNVIRTGMSIAYTTGGETSEAESLKTVARAKELGVTILDTASAYGFGANEQLLGEMPDVFLLNYRFLKASIRKGAGHDNAELNKRLRLAPTSRSSKLNAAICCRARRASRDM
jgi:Aldo/keto reductase family